MHAADLAIGYAVGVKGDKTAFPAGRELIEKNQALATRFLRSSVDLERLEKSAINNNKPFVTPVHRNDTRMASTWKLLQTNLILREAYAIFFATQPKHKDLFLTDEEWESTAEFEGTLRLTASVISKCQTERAPTASYIWVFADTAIQAAADPRIDVVDALIKEPRKSVKSAFQRSLV